MALQPTATKRKINKITKGLGRTIQGDQAAQRCRLPNSEVRAQQDESGASGSFDEVSWG